MKDSRIEKESYDRDVRNRIEKAVTADILALVSYVDYMSLSDLLGNITNQVDMLSRATDVIIDSAAMGKRVLQNIEDKVKVSL